MTQTTLMRLIGSRGKLLASQYTYFKACWGTPGGGSPPACAVQTTFSTASAIATFDNPAGSGRVAIIDYIRLLVKSADTNGTAMYVTGMMDQQQRFSSGGLQPIPPEYGPIAVSGMNGVGGQMPVLVPHFGPLNLVAAGANRLLTSPGILVKKASAAPVMVVEDELLFSYGFADDAPGVGQTKLSSANPTLWRTHMGLALIEPGCNYSLPAWFPGLTVGFTFEPEVAWWEFDPSDGASLPHAVPD